MEDVTFLTIHHSLHFKTYCTFYRQIFVCPKNMSWCEQKAVWANKYTISQCENEWRYRFTTRTLWTGNMWLYKNRTHAADILGGTWPTTVERRTTADSVFNLTSACILFQRMVSKLACKYDGLARSSPLQMHPHFSYFSTLRSRLCLHVSCSSNKHSHPSINLSVHLLKHRVRSVNRQI